MSEKISVIGGDLRASSLAKMFEEDGNEVSVYGMEKSDEIMEDQGLKKCKSVKEAIENSDVIIGSVPFAKDSEKMYAVFSDKDIEINDLVKKKYKGKIFIAGGIDKKSYDSSVFKEELEYCDKWYYRELNHIFNKWKEFKVKKVIIKI